MKKTQDFLSKPIRILLVTNSLVLIAGSMLGPIYALFIEGIGGNLLDVSIVAAGFSLIAGITTLIIGRLSDDVKESELIIVVGYTLMGLGFISYMFVDSVLSLFMVGALIGFAEAIYSPAFDGVYTKHMEKETAGNVWGIWEAMNYFAGATGALMGGLLVSRYGFDFIFITMAVLCFLSALYIYLLPRIVL
ncbi:MFS transporter [Patescibacteria group bacterium]|nr:MFS transporter [Patescibacteria group bacterium]